MLADKSNCNRIFSRVWVKVLLVAVFLPALFFVFAGAKKPHPDCYVNLYIEPIDWVGNSRALRHCKERFEAGDARSGYWLGNYYAKQGDGEQALFYWVQAAEMGDAWAIYLIGSIRFYDIYNSYNKLHRYQYSGLVMIRQAADMGFGHAQEKYAFIYDRVLNERNLDIAWEYYNRAADSGEEFAMITLFDLYVSGDSSTERKIKNCQIPPWISPEPPTTYRERDTYAGLPLKECDEEKGLQYLKDAARMGSMKAMELLRAHYRDQQEPDEVLETYWLLQMSMWEHPLPNFEIIMKNTTILFQPGVINVGNLALSKKFATEELEKKDGKIVAQAKLMLETEWDKKENRAFTCSHALYSWYYICQGE